MVSDTLSLLLTLKMMSFRILGEFQGAGASWGVGRLGRAAKEAGVLRPWEDWSLEKEGMD